MQVKILSALLIVLGSSALPCPSQSANPVSLWKRCARVLARGHCCIVVVLIALCYGNAVFAGGFHPADCFDQDQGVGTGVPVIDCIFFGFFGLALLMGLTAKIFDFVAMVVGSSWDFVCSLLGRLRKRS